MDVIWEHSNTVTQYPVGSDSCFVRVSYHRSDHRHPQEGRDGFERMLGLIDAGRELANWPIGEKAVSLFRSKMAAASGKHMVKSVWLPLGKVPQRQATSKAFATSLTGAPNDHAAEIRCRPAFVRKARTGRIMTMDPLHGAGPPAYSLSK